MGKVDKVGENTRTFYVSNDIMLDTLKERLGQDINEELSELPISCADSELWNGESCCSVNFNIYKDENGNKDEVPIDVIFYREQKKTN